MSIVHSGLIKSIHPIPSRPTAGAGSWGAQQPHLGIYAKSASASDPDLSQRLRELRADRFRFLATARELFIAEGHRHGLAYADSFHRTAQCLHVRHSDTVGVYHSTEHNRAFYGGLVTCGSVWACPVCAAKIQERRRAEIAAAMDWAYSQHLQPMLITLTVPHRADQSLVEIRAMVTDALRRMRAGRAGIAMRDELGYRGLIRSLEITHGQNGWHLHTHELWLVRRDADAEAARALILERWRVACVRAGLLDPNNASQLVAFDAHSVDVRGNCSASDYLAKMDDSTNWGVDRELAKASSKAGKKSGRHPFGLLADAADGCDRSGRLFIEYAVGMKGARQLFWSRGLKKQVGILDFTDEDLAEQEVSSADCLGELSSGEWTTVINARAKSALLDAAEAGGWPAVEALIARLQQADDEQRRKTAASGLAVWQDGQAVACPLGACEPVPAPTAPADVVTDHPCSPEPEPQADGLPVERVVLDGVPFWINVETGEYVPHVELSSARSG